MNITKELKKFAPRTLRKKGENRIQHRMRVGRNRKKGRPVISHIGYQEKHSSHIYNIGAKIFIDEVAENMRKIYEERDAKEANRGK